VENAARPSIYLREKDPVTIVEEAWWDPKPCWAGADNLAFTCMRSPGRQILMISCTNHTVPHSTKQLSLAIPICTLNLLFILVF